MEKGAQFYICGDGARMAPDVKKSLARIAYEFNPRIHTLQQAEDYVTSMSVQGKLFFGRVGLNCLHFYCVRVR